MAKAAKPSTKMPPKYRDAKTGRYTTQRYADQNPNTTVKETDRPRMPKEN